MRIILSNEDAERLTQLIEANPDVPLKVEVRERTGEGGTVWVSMEASEFRGKARRTPSEQGMIRVEDLDGRVIFESYGEAPASE